MHENSIIIKGARQNNLKNIDVTIPRNKLIVITGISGSGKFLHYICISINNMLNSFF